MIERIRAALNEHRRPLFTIENVLRDLESGDAQLWQCRETVMVTTMTNYPDVGEKLCEAWLAAGDLADIRQMTPHMLDWAKAEGCTQAELNGRLGWAKALAPYGFEYLSTVTRKLLT